MDYFKDNLRYLRLQKGLKHQGDLAVLFDLSNSQISNYEKGTSFPPMQLAFKFCEFFDIGLDDLFRRDIRPPIKPPDGERKALTTEGATENDDGRATESPPPKQESVKEMKKQLLEMMMKLETMDS